jgi:precorrin-3B C17-methyltransferase
MTPARTPGRLLILGLGPGAPGLLAPDAAAALDAAEVVVGYRGYLEPIADRLAGKEVVGRELGEEVGRARIALELAESGRVVALVSSGDAGVYGMAGVALELAAKDGGGAAEIAVIPGITAALAASARLGSPLAHDWCSISLSDLLTPWETIARRVEAAARADFVVALYNPRSKARTRQLPEVARLLLRHRDPATPVGLVENATRPGERAEIIRLDRLASADVSMFTIVIVGSSRTFASGGRMITPRIYAAKASPELALDPRPSAPGHPRAALGDAIMAESLAIIDRELGPEPADPAERAIVRRMVHATADFDLARGARFAPGAIDAALAALRRGAPILTDVEMLRAGVRRDLAAPLGVEVHCGLASVDPSEPVPEGRTRSALGLERAARRLGDGAIVAVGNAPTALVRAIELVGHGWRPACLVGIPVGFVGVEESKRRLVEGRAVPWITALGRKGGTAATAAAVNALLELARDGRT